MPSGNNERVTKIFTVPSDNLAKIFNKPHQLLLNKQSQKMNHYQRLKYLHFLLLTILYSCRSNDNPDYNRPSYFNLSDFIENESKRLSAQKFGVDKTVFLNGKEERKSILIIDWNNELNAFKEADINKKSLLGKYKVDSIGDGNDLLVKYSSLHENFRTKELTIQYNLNEKPVRITVTVATNNVLYSSRNQLIYEPEHGYWISGNQKIRFLEPDSFHVVARFDKH